MLTMLGMIFWIFFGRNIQCINPLLEAIKERNLSRILASLDTGNSVNDEFKPGLTPLRAAILLKEEEVAKALIQRGASLRTRNKNMETPLHLAVREGLQSTVQFMLDRGAQIDAHSAHEDRPLMIAIRCGQMEIVHLLLSRGADVNKRNIEGSTSLHIATRFLDHRNVDVFKALIRYGADINAIDDHGYTPLHDVCCRHKDPVIADFLVEEGALIEVTDNEGHTPLDLAVNNMMKGPVHSLIEFEADFNRYQPLTLLEKFWPCAHQVTKGKFVNFDDYVFHSTNAHLSRPDPFGINELIAYETENRKIFALYRVLKSAYVKQPDEKPSVLENLRFDAFDQAAMKIFEKTYVEFLPIELMTQVLTFNRRLELQLQRSTWNVAFAKYKSCIQERIRKKRCINKI